MTESTVIHWANLGSLVSHGQPGQVFALWPGPVDHDACFAEAGFHEFADSSDRWASKFRDMLDRLVATLSQ